MMNLQANISLSQSSGHVQLKSDLIPIFEYVAVYPLRTKNPIWFSRVGMAWTRMGTIPSTWDGNVTFSTMDVLTAIRLELVTAEEVQAPGAEALLALLKAA